MNTKNTTAIATTDQNTGYLTETVNLAELFSEELDGLRPSFERIKIPAGGGLAYEVPGDDPNSPGQQPKTLAPSFCIITRSTVTIKKNSPVATILPTAPA